MKTSMLPPQIANVPQAINKLNLPISHQWLTRAALALIAIVAIIAINALFFAQKKTVAQNTHNPVLTVTTQLATTKAVERILSAHGSIAAWDPVSVGATTSGLQVKNVLVEEGMLVKKDQLLAILDSDQLQAQIESERARLSASESNVGKSIQPNRPEDINGLAAAVSQAQANVGDQQAGLIQAKANLANARTNFKRYQYLRVEGAVSAQETETREMNMQVCEAAVSAAEKRVQAAEYALKQGQERLSMAHIGGRKEDIQIARANVAETKANIKRLQTQIAQTFIKAPIAGLIARRDVHIGDIDTAGKTMFLMSRDNRLELRAQIPENDLSLVRPGQKVTINSALSNKGKIAGIVREISPLVDADTRLATVRIDVPNNCGLKQGMYAEGNINVGKTFALTVPSQAVISRDEKNIVFVLHNDKVESRPVAISNRNSDFIQISSGLTNNDQVIIDGAGFLKDGDYVAVAR